MYCKNYKVFVIPDKIFWKDFKHAKHVQIFPEDLVRNDKLFYYSSLKAQPLTKKVTPYLIKPNSSNPITNPRLLNPIPIITQQLLLNILINRIRMHKINPAGNAKQKTCFCHLNPTGLNGRGR